MSREPLDAARDIALAAASSSPRRAGAPHVHLVNAWSIALASRTPALSTSVFGAPDAWNLPDGKPVTWFSRRDSNGERLHQVRGPQLMLDVCDVGRELSVSHFLLGSTPEVLERLQANLEQRYPGIRIVDACSPPFRELSGEEIHDIDARILASGAQIVWVGLGTPKQDYEAARVARDVGVTAVAVGAAFDYGAGTLLDAPRWVRALGLEWLWRFGAEPRRLWRRYLFGNLRFLMVVIGQRLRRHG